MPTSEHTSAIRCRLSAASSHQSIVRVAGEKLAPVFTDVCGARVRGRRARGVDGEEEPARLTATHRTGAARYVPSRRALGADGRSCDHRRQAWKVVTLRSPTTMSGSISFWRGGWRRECSRTALSWSMTFRRSLSRGASEPARRGRHRGREVAGRGVAARARATRSFPSAMNSMPRRKRVARR